MNAHEMACKEAESDALKRAAMKLGISMGLGLYEKTGDFVDDAPKPAPTQVLKPTGVGITEQDVERATNRDALNKRITAMSKVVIAKRLKTLDELKADMKTKYGVDSTQALSDTQAKELLANLEAMANG
jgi:recombination DNA repair RAD52 pathway protein